MLCMWNIEREMVKDWNVLDVEKDPVVFQMYTDLWRSSK